MGLQIEALAQFAAQAQWEDVPEPVQRHAKLVLLDTLGVVILAGAERPEVRELRDALAGTTGTWATVFARGWPTHDPRTAALLNGIAGRSIDLCEGLRFISGQAAMQVLPGVLAVAEHLGSSGRDMLASFVLGYDVAARLAGGAPALGASERSGVAAGRDRRRSAAARARRGRDQPGHAHRNNVAADAELYQRGGRCDGAQRRRRDERLCRRARSRIGACRFRGAGRCHRAGPRRSPTTPRLASWPGCCRPFTASVRSPP
jgi:MmgE/PrpD N-terminal domain